MFQQDLPSIILDLGSTTIKAGYSGEEAPKFMSSSCVGCINNQMLHQSKPQKYYVGDSSLNLKKQGMQIQQVLSYGKITNFENYQKLIQGVLYQEMRIDPSNFSLLLSEDNIHNSQDRLRISTFVFQTLNIKNIFFCKSAVLSCFALGKSTGTIVDCGADMSSVIAVNDGFALSKTIKRGLFGGQSINRQVQKYIQLELKVPVVPRVALINQIGLTASYLQYHKNLLLRDIKETVFKIQQGQSEVDLVQYELPDKNIIKLERTKITNIFLDSPCVDGSFKGLHNLVYQNINQCDSDLKRQLYGNIIITGGNSLMSGLSNKLQIKVAQLVPPNVKLKLINFPFAMQRRFSPWTGGSILTSLSSFQSFWVGKQEWEQHGSLILDKKCA